ncbi:MAG: histidine kinase, partial [Candidatus Promineifilaceae bacterium]|nr:histidine kinase [Candidatus Promineifilaceae bacterium]
QLAGLLITGVLTSVLYRHVRAFLQKRVDRLMYGKAGTPPAPSEEMRSIQEASTTSQANEAVYPASRRMLFARWTAWFLVVAYVILAGAGLILQGLAQSSYAQTTLPVLIILVSLVGVWIVTGALIISRHPRHPVGWLLCAGFLLTAGFDMFAAGYAAYDTYAYSGSLPGVDLALVWLKLVNLGPHGLVAFTLIILLFPDGRFPAPHWRKVAWITVGTLLLFLPLQAVEPGLADPSFLPTRTNPLGISASLWVFLKPLLWTTFSILVLCYGAAFVSLIVRLRDSRGDVRQQIKWLLFPAGLYGIFLLLFIMGTAQADEAFVAFSIAIGQIALAGMVIAIAFAIFKYRLYDVDLIINRSLVYGALTLAVIAVYVLVVGALGVLFQSQSNLLIGLLATGLVAVLFQPLRERLQRGVNRLLYGERDDPFEALAQLGRQLESAVPPHNVLPMLVETIAQTLKLPYVAIHLRAKNEDTIAAEDGDPSSDVADFPLVYQGESIGRLVVALRSPGASFSPTEVRLLRNIARQAGAAVHAVQLMADLQRSRQKLVTAREEERLRLRRDLHDGLGPALASVIWQADSARDLVYTDPPEAEQLLESSIEQAQSALFDIRRLVYGLRPPALDELGLVDALKQVIRQYRQTAVTIEAPALLPALPAAVEVATYRIVQEALKNAVEHGQADNCLIGLALDDNLCLTIGDDGLGLPEMVTPGIGLVSMRERAEELGGTFKIHPRPRGGTKVEVSLPLELGS